VDNQVEIHLARYKDKVYLIGQPYGCLISQVLYLYFYYKFEFFQVIGDLHSY